MQVGKPNDPTKCKHHRRYVPPNFGQKLVPSCAISYDRAPCIMRPNCTYWKAKPPETFSSRQSGDWNDHGTWQGEIDYPGK